MHPLTFATAPSLRIEVNAAGDLPKRIKVLGWGENSGANGKFILNSASAALLAANQKATGYQRIAIDFEHNSVRTSPTYKGEPVSVAGHGDVEVVPGEGLFLNNVSWTQKGREHIAAGDYPDISPALTTNPRRETTFIHSVGAVRNGAIDGLTFSLNSADGALATLLNQIQPNSATMLDPKALLLKLLGLSADATDEQIEDAAEKAGKAATGEVEMNAAPAEQIKKLETNVAALTQLVERIQTNSSAGEIAALKAQAAREGKVIPASVLSLELNAAQLGSIIADLPVTMPLDQRTPGATPPAGALELNSAEEAVRATLGLSKEAWDKFAK